LRPLAPPRNQLRIRRNPIRYR
jgi:hypothetical protein